MPKSLIFWMIFILAVLVWLGGVFGPPNDARAFSISKTVVEFVLLGLLGWKVYGPAVT